MKTKKEWIETFPEPYKTQAMKNTEDQDQTRMFSFEKEKLPIAAIALSFAFQWSETPEGHQYWEDFYNELWANRHEHN